MKYIISFFTFCGLALLGYSISGSIAIALWVYGAYELFTNSSKLLAFREFMLTLYGMNFLLSPALTYHSPDLDGGYPMKIAEEEYFEIAIPAMLCLRAGLYWVKTEIFNFNFQLARLQAIANQEVLKFWLIAGILLKAVAGIFPGELSFVAYVLSTVRFIAAFSLYAVDAKKYRWWLVFVLLFEMAISIRAGMFHDTVMWFIFFGLFWTFLKKPSAIRKIVMAGVAICCFVVLQVSKNAYRAATYGQEGNIGTFVDVVSENASKGIFADENVNSSVNRVNQAWILASTIQNMDRRKDFQGLRLVGLYLEAAILPRFIAPNKLSSGNKEIFRKYSGHYLRGTTSMGLGVLGDGYVAFGYWGTLIFSLLLGLLFGVVFKVIEGWGRISPYFVLFIFPILNYAVRPDCETQTIITHLFKATIIFGFLMMYYRTYFRKRIYMLKKKEDNTGRSIKSSIPGLT